MDSDTPVGPLTDEVIAIAEKAGAEILARYKKKGLKVSMKPDQTPVTEADQVANELICRELEKISDAPVVSEEGDQKGWGTIGSQDFWLVDPLDGTREFIGETGEFSVNIALVRGGKPVLGVIFSPVDQIVCFAQVGKGAGKKESGGSPIKIIAKPFSFEDFIVVMSRRHNKSLPGYLRTLWPGCRVLKLGSSLKFCSIAEGRAHLYVRMGPTSLWDTAAGQVILEEAGGKLVTKNGKKLAYSPDNLINPHFWAVSDKNQKTDFLSALSGDK